MHISSRTELKYPCSSDSLENIKAILCDHPSWTLDKNCYEQKPYWVASLYWDSPDYINYQDSQNGVLKKSKLRLRSYAHPHDPESAFKTLKAEVKHRQGRTCYKAVHQIKDLDQKSIFNLNCNEVFGDRLWHYYRKNTPSYKLQNLFPVVTVLYQRLSFVHLNQKSRITLDSNIIALSPSLFFQAFEQSCETENMSGVLELKDCTLKHAEIYKIIALSDAKKEKFSKYNQCLEKIAL